MQEFHALPLHQRHLQLVYPALSSHPCLASCLTLPVDERALFALHSSLYLSRAVLASFPCLSALFLGHALSLLHHRHLGRYPLHFRLVQMLPDTLEDAQIHARVQRQSLHVITLSATLAWYICLT
jgi:hypothetical protein